MIFKILILKMVFKTFLLNGKNNITITNEFGGEYEHSSLWLIFTLPEWFRPNVH